LAGVLHAEHCLQSHSLTPWAKFNLFVYATTNSSSIQTMCQMMTKASVRLGLDAVNHRKKQQDIHLYVDQMSEHKTKEKRLEVVKDVTNLSPKLVEKLQAIAAAKKKKRREELIEEMLDQQDAEVVGNLKNKGVTLVGGIGLVVFSCGLVALAIGGLCYHGWWGKIAVVFIILLEVCVTFCVCTFWLAGFVEALQLRDRFFSSGFHFSICDTTQHGNSCLLSCGCCW